MVRKGFTFIELTIALAVAALLLALAVPQYNSYSRQNDFNRRLQGLIGCIQQAQQQAATPGTTQVRYSQLSLSQNSNGNLDCTSTLYPVASLAQILSGTVTPIRAATTSSFSRLLLSGSTTTLRLVNSGNCSTKPDLTLFFGSLEQGAPAGILCSGAPLLSIPSFGNGFPVQINLQDSQNATLTNTIIMPTYGVPIQLLNL